MARRVSPYFDNLEFPAYEYHEYPRMVYGEGGATATVASKAEADALQGAWFKDPQLTQRFGNALAGAAKPAEPVRVATGAAAVQPSAGTKSISTPLTNARVTVQATEQAAS